MAEKDAQRAEPASAVALKAHLHKYGGNNFFFHVEKLERLF